MLCVERERIGDLYFQHEFGVVQLHLNRLSKIELKLYDKLLEVRTRSRLEVN